MKKKPDNSRLKYSVDGGKTWLKAPDGLVITHPVDEGDDPNQVLDIKVGNKHLFLEIWTKDAMGDDWLVAEQTTTFNDLAKALEETEQ